MTSTTKCECDAPHVKQVELSRLHILGPGTFWLAAKPGRTYLAGHGWHFEDEQAAREYAFGPPTPKPPPLSLRPLKGGHQTELPEGKT